jgi:hypothetical protein
MNADPVLRLNTCELVNAANTTIRQNESSSFQDPLTVILFCAAERGRTSDIGLLATDLEVHEDKFRIPA